MDRELVLVVLLLLTAGPVVVLAGVRSGIAAIEPCAAARERRLWAAVVAPLIAALVVIGALVGWALHEPDDAELVPVPWLVVVVPTAVVWTRAIVRAIRAALPRPPTCSAETVGLVWPRVRLAPGLTAILDETAVAAALAHEDAHARQRDPLRIWIGQLATDLQWPLAGARRRFEDWLVALELARDEEARRAGVDGADLAAAIVAAARLQRCGGPRVAALAAGDAVALRERVERLLSPLAPEPATTRASLVPFFAALVAATVFGAAFGEPLVQLLLLGRS